MDSTVTEKKACGSCHGSGKCLKCDGTGHVLHNPPTPIAVVSGKIRGESQTGTRRTCPRCYGSGVCSTCKGTGKVS